MAGPNNLWCRHLTFELQAGQVGRCGALRAGGARSPRGAGGALAGRRGRVVLVRRRVPPRERRQRSMCGE